MKDYEFVGAEVLNEEQLLQIVHLLLEAEYSGNAKIGSAFNMLDTKDERLQTIKPYIKHTKVLMDHDNVVGFFIATTKQQVNEISDSIAEWRKHDSELTSCLNFYMHETVDSDFILHDVAIDPKYRGRGFFKIFNKYLFELASHYSCTKILFLVRESNPALYIYKHYGARLFGEIDTAGLHFNDRLIKCCFVL